MIIKIVEKLKTGSVKTVLPFGVDYVGALPYTVVKPEKNGQFRSFRIIAHFPPSNIIELGDYILSEVPALLLNFEATDRAGNTNSLYTDSDYSDIIANNSDGSIAMEWVVNLPQVPIF